LHFSGHRNGVALAHNLMADTIVYLYSMPGCSAFVCLESKI
jgi:hypothetical protein